MRLHRIRVEHVRGLPVAEVHFCLDGVTVVEAPNESGKTSLFDAFDVLLKEKHSTTKQHVKDLQPVGQDVGSLVEAELTVAGTHLTVRKRFNRDRMTELTVHAPTPRQVAGNEAHDELGRILQAGTDMALFEALRFQQGRGLESLSLAGSEQLARQLDASAGGSGVTADDALYGRVVAAFERYFTPTGQDGKELRAADMELEEADAEVTHLAATAAQLAEAGAQSTELQRERARLTRALDALAPQLEQHRRDVERLGAVRGALQTARTQLRAAATDRDAALARREARDEQIQAVDRLLKRLTQRQSRAEATGAAWREQQVRVDELTDALQDAEREEAAARASLRTARAGADLGRRRSELRVDRERRRRIEAALAQASGADAFLADHPFTPKQLATIREAADRLRLVEARLGEDAPTVRIRARHATEVSVDGGVSRLKPGEHLDLQVPERLLVGVDGLEVEVRAGSSLTERQAERDAMRARLEAACHAVGCADREAAEELARTRDEYERALVQRDAVIARELDGGTRDQLDDRIRRLETQAAELEAALTPDAAQLALVTDDDADRLPQVEFEEETARTRTDAVRAELQALANEVARLRDAATQATTAAALDRDELAGARDRLDVARRLTSDDSVRASLEASELEHQRAGDRLVIVTDELDALNPEEVELLANNAERQRERLNDDLDGIRDRSASVRALIEVRGGLGVGEALDTAEAERDRRSEARRSLRARAEAARVLRVSFEMARDAAYAAYREPLRQRIVRAGRFVFGEDLQVELDEHLRVVRRTLGGVTLEFDRLSAGAREQLAILTALAAADLAGEDGVPLVLDDTLGYTDPTRLERIGAVLGRVRGPQIVVLTCVSDRFRAVGGAQVVQLQVTSPRV